MRDNAADGTDGVAANPVPVPPQNHTHWPTHSVAACMSGMLPSSGSRPRPSPACSSQQPASHVRLFQWCNVTMLESEQGGATTHARLLRCLLCTVPPPTTEQSAALLPAVAAAASPPDAGHPRPPLTTKAARAATRTQKSELLLVSWVASSANN
jgi:hypothetical protein